MLESSYGTVPLLDNDRVPKFDRKSATEYIGSRLCGKLYTAGNCMRERLYSTYNGGQKSVLLLS